MKITLCTHIKTNGIACDSPALKRQRYCYFHLDARERAKRQHRAARLQHPFQLPLLEDANAIQVAIGDTLNALLAGRIDHKTAGLILYGLQTAAANIRHTDFAVCDGERRAVTYCPEEPETADPEPAEDGAQPAPPILVAKALPPRKGPYSAEERELLAHACNVAMDRARAIKEQFKDKK